MDPQPGDDDLTAEQGPPPDDGGDRGGDGDGAGPAGAGRQPGERFLDGYVPI